MRRAPALLLVLLTVACKPSLAAGRWRNPQPQGNTLRAVWAAPGAGAYAVGDHGTILHSDSRGSWATQESGTRANLLGVWGSGKDDVYAVGWLGAAGVIVHTVDGGKTWTPQQEAGVRELHAVWGSGKDDVYAVGYDGEILHTADSGKSWSAQAGKKGATLNAVWGSGKGDVYAVGGTNILHTVDSGATWTLVPAGASVDFSAVVGSGKDDVYVSGGAGTLLHSGDGGKTFAQAAIDRNDFIGGSAIWCGGAGQVVVAGFSRDGTIFVSGDRGASFLPRPFGGRTNLYGIAGAGGDLYAVGDAGTILRSGDGGKVWSAETKSVSSDGLQAVWGAGKDVILTVGSQQVLRSGDGGDSWETRKDGGASLSGIWGSGDTVYAVGLETFLRSTDGGKSWAPAGPSVIERSLRAVWASGKDVYALGVAKHGSGSLILHSRDGGATWDEQNDGSWGYLGAVWGSGPGDVYVVGADGAAGLILHSTDGGKSWRRVPNEASSLSGVWGGSAGEVYAAGQAGGKWALLRSADHGKSWTMQTGADWAGLHAVSGSGKDVYAVGDSGLLVHSTDGGTSWREEDSGTANTLHGVWGSPSGAVFAVGDGGTILRLR